MPNTPPLAPTNARQVSSNAALKKLPAAARASIFAWGTLPDADLLHVSQNSSWKRRCVGQGRQQFGYEDDFGRGRWMDWHLQQQKRARRPQSCRIRTSLPSVASHARSTKLLVWAYADQHAALKMSCGRHRNQHAPCFVTRAVHRAVLSSAPKLSRHHKKARPTWQAITRKRSMLDRTCVKLWCRNHDVNHRYGCARISGPHRAPHTIKKSPPSSHGSPS